MWNSRCARFVGGTRAARGSTMEAIQDQGSRCARPRPNRGGSRCARPRQNIMGGITRCARPFRGFSRRGGLAQRAAYPGSARTRTLALRAVWPSSPRQLAQRAAARLARSAACQEVPAQRAGLRYLGVWSQRGARLHASHRAGREARAVCAASPTGRQRAARGLPTPWGWGPALCAARGVSISSICPWGLCNVM